MTDPAVVYERAHKALLAGDYPLAIKIYEALMARYPFAAETRQSRLDVIYCYYKAGESESAIDAADTFIRENPTIRASTTRGTSRGSTDFERCRTSWSAGSASTSTSVRHPGAALVRAFQTVVEQYPNSDTRTTRARRMVYLRNRLADYEIAVAHYYMESRRLRGGRAARQGCHRGLRRRARGA
jgi:outer membrane protein assembly factor BamD